MLLLSRCSSVCGGGAAAASLVKRTVQRRSYHFGFLGLDDDRNGSFLPGPSFAPVRVREALRYPSANSFTELGYNLFPSAATGRQPLIRDFGDLQCADIAEIGQVHAAIHKALEGVLRAGLMPTMVGGDHSLTYPVLKSLAELEPTVTRSAYVLHFDAHGDIYHNFLGNPFSHASPFARICESKLVAGVVQIGVRTLTEDQRDQQRKFGVHCVEGKDMPLDCRTMKEYYDKVIPKNAPVYVSVDLDVLDPAFAPGVSHHEPGGMSSRQLLDAIHAIPDTNKLIGFDVMEYNPLRDLNGNMTAMVAARIYRELCSVALRQRGVVPWTGQS